MDKCAELKDYTTANFLNWFLGEQVEEEAIARRCLEIFDIVDQQGLGFLMIDREIALVRGPSSATCRCVTKYHVVTYNNIN